MPELPEVETTCRGIADHVTGHVITKVKINNPSLRWPVPVQEIQSSLPGQEIITVKRRAKYIILDCGNGHLLIHLGMSGSLRILNKTCQLEKHEHVEIFFANGTVLRLRDPRRFGAVLWTDQEIESHPLIASLGPEPLGDKFNQEYLYQKTRKRQRSIKNLIMDAHIVVGVGNIYASEALFHAAIRPGKSASRLTKKECFILATKIRHVLPHCRQGCPLRP